MSQSPARPCSWLLLAICSLSGCIGVTVDEPFGEAVDQTSLGKLVGSWRLAGQSDTDPPNALLIQLDGSQLRLAATTWDKKKDASSTGGAFRFEQGQIQLRSIGATQLMFVQLEAADASQDLWYLYRFEQTSRQSFRVYFPDRDAFEKLREGQQAFSITAVPEQKPKRLHISGDMSALTAEQLKRCFPDQNLVTFRMQVEAKE